MNLFPWNIVLSKEKYLRANQIWRSRQNVKYVNSLLCFTFLIALEWPLGLGLRPLRFGESFCYKLCCLPPLFNCLNSQVRQLFVKLVSCSLLCQLAPQEVSASD